MHCHRISENEFSGEVKTNRIYIHILILIPIPIPIHI